MAMEIVEEYFTHNILRTRTQEKDTISQIFWFYMKAILKSITSLIKYRLMKTVNGPDCRILLKNIDIEDIKSMEWNSLEKYRCLKYWLLD